MRIENPHFPFSGGSPPPDAAFSPETLSTLYISDREKASLLSQINTLPRFQERYGALFEDLTHHTFGEGLWSDPDIPLIALKAFNLNLIDSLEFGSILVFYSALKTGRENGLMVTPISLKPNAPPENFALLEKALANPHNPDLSIPLSRFIEKMAHIPEPMRVFFLLPQVDYSIITPIIATSGLTYLIWVKEHDLTASLPLKMCVGELLARDSPPVEIQPTIGPLTREDIFGGADRGVRLVAVPFPPLGDLPKEADGFPTPYDHLFTNHDTYHFYTDNLSGNRGRAFFAELRKALSSLKPPNPTIVEGIERPLNLCADREIPNPNGLSQFIKVTNLFTNMGQENVNWLLDALCEKWPSSLKTEKSHWIDGIDPDDCNFFTTGFLIERLQQIRASALEQQ